MERATHTWDISLAYHGCPECGYIIESRKAFKRSLKSLKKQISCPRCHHTFTLEKPLPHSFGPLLDGATNTEFTWD